MRKTSWKFLAGRLAREERGQILIMSAVLMTVFFGVAAVTVDIGHVYVSYSQLVASTNAAALAGAEAISNPNLGSPATVATDYGSQSGKLNASSSLLNVVTTPTVSCNTALESAPTSVVCVEYSGSGTNTANVIKVTQTAQVHTFFAGTFGARLVNLSATSYALRAGAQSVPTNIAIVVDSTRSMTTIDSNCSYGSSLSRFQCALDGVQTLLQSMAPCYSSETSCAGGTGDPDLNDGITTPSVDRVALFTFPNMTTSTIPYEYCDGGSKGTTCASSGSYLGVEPYTYPSTTGTSYTAENIGTTSSPSWVSYLVTYASTSIGYASNGVGSDSNGFVSDYKTSDGTSTLNTASDLVTAIGASSSSTSGMDAQGGAGTYYAGAIYAAEAALYAEQQANPGSQNVLILLSDGDATSTQSQMEASNNGYTLGSGSTYPSYNYECQQAVVAAGGTVGENWTPNTAAFSKARASISRIYAIAYGSEASTTCAGDTYTPCQTMKGIASSQNYFYSDNNQSGAGNDSSCVGTASTSTNLETIFSDIASDFSAARLISAALYNSGS
jgi:Flp pilus assembly protein TadG